MTQDASKPLLVNRRVVASGLMGALLAPGFGAARANDMRTIKEKWSEVIANAERFRVAAAKRGLMRQWDTAIPVQLSFRPPAKEADVARVEAELGHVLPEPLRQFFVEAASGVEIAWVLPGRETRTPEGLVDVQLDIMPPEPLIEVSRNANGVEMRRWPKVSSGRLSFKLTGLPLQKDGAQGWIKSFEKSAAEETDEGTRLHYQRYADFWRRGIALTAGGGGDVLAVDRESADGNLIYLFHEGADEPGWFLERSLIDFLLDLSRLGFPDVDVTELLVFRKDGHDPGADAQLYEARHGAEAKLHNLAMPSSVIISPESANGVIWREWLGIK